MSQKLINPKTNPLSTKLSTLMDSTKPMSSQNPIQKALDKATQGKPNTPPKPTTVIKLDEKRLGDKLNSRPSEPRPSEPNSNTLSAQNSPKQNTLLNTAKPAEFKKVDIVIAGTTHRINCPSDKVDRLLATAETINNNLRNMRKNVVGKSPSNEELLVLHCLELYDTINELRQQGDFYLGQNERLGAILDKLIHDVNHIG